ncbi:hypothetical protein [Dactylosporangium cerinum]
MTQDRWDEVMDLLVAAVPAGPATVVVDGTDERTGQVADRLAAALRAAGRPCTRPPGDAPAADAAVVVADGPFAREHPPVGGWDVIVWLRTSRRQHEADGTRGDTADVVVDLHDPDWPVIRHLAPGSCRITAGT